jgi:hypothetical protein
VKLPPIDEQKYVDKGFNFGRRVFPDKREEFAQPQQNQLE